MTIITQRHNYVNQKRKDFRHQVSEVLIKLIYRTNSLTVSELIRPEFDFVPAYFIGKAASFNELGANA